MVINFSTGKIIANQHELVVRIDGEARVTMQAQVDEVTLIGGANVITATGSGIQWSVRLDNENQLQALADAIGIAVKNV
ncbi:DUF3389 domain-containing protein [Photobacterium sanguinicancri]|uniref:DUF3389 domain-containing protein n=1 Tax=Photobacterium sanguinicancri TaxID=875932 RepID=A0AAW7Y705_9GAMM|nr:DUF3389 domain-containing protein [Photobacterium sanguinicancri]KXI23481.1 PTS sugar transporter subunit IIA [Photobacterium sanguinicancri]MDO6499219.1 DUF3389 domain-containing protein [Photobacterium sanguinicancri]MDO6542777.1 DUF3389 domain-containing protein [Photobacterium sanguinicancri]OZS42852.1 DUF3389 domain-containing protein [Photobacterium sanguinicancri]